MFASIYSMGNDGIQIKVFNFRLLYHVNTIITSPLIWRFYQWYYFQIEIFNLKLWYHVDIIMIGLLYDEFIDIIIDLFIYLFNKVHVFKQNTTLQIINFNKYIKKPKFKV